MGDTDVIEDVILLMNNRQILSGRIVFDSLKIRADKEGGSC